MWKSRCTGNRFSFPKGRYLNYLIYLTDITWIPRPLLRFLGGFPAGLLDRPVFDDVFDICRRITDGLRLIAKGFGRFTQGTDESDQKILPPDPVNPLTT